MKLWYKITDTLFAIKMIWFPPKYEQKQEVLYMISVDFKNKDWDEYICKEYNINHGILLIRDINDILYGIPVENIVKFKSRRKAD